MWQEMLAGRAWVKLRAAHARMGRTVSLTENNALSEDVFVGGRVRVRQPARGYRVNADTLLLAAAVEAADGARLMEAGCGAGAATLVVAARSVNTNFVGVERDQNMAAIARENVALNAMSARINIAIGDALDRNEPWGVFDGVFANPPFDREGEGNQPADARRHAYIAEEPIERWIAALADRLRGGAPLTLIHRASKLSELCAAFEGRLGGLEVYPIRPRAEAPAKRVLVRARKGSRAPLALLKGLDLHDASGARHTDEAEAILRGDALIRWS